VDQGSYWSALVGYSILAEQGCEVAGANAAFLLQQGLGWQGDDATQIAADLLRR
jgi:hypothetical protein